MTWLRSKKPSDDTLVPLTPTTHGEPVLNELDPSDPTVQALTSPRPDKTPLPAAPRRDGGGLR